MNSGRFVAFVFSEPVTVSVQEGSVANFTVLRNGSADDAVVVQYITVNGDATAEEGDFVPSGKNSVILFDVGEREQNLSVYINDDDTPETDETFYIILFNSTGKSFFFFVAFFCYLDLIIKKYLKNNVCFKIFIQ